MWFDSNPMPAPSPHDDGSGYYKTVDFFGGAIQTRLPHHFRDVAEYFPLADTNEVYQDERCVDNIFSIELLERAADVSNAACGAFFLRDAVGAEGAAATASIESEEALVVEEALPLLLASSDITGPVREKEIFACELTATSRLSAPSCSNNKNNNNHNATKQASYRLSLAVVRLPTPVNTDVVLYLQRPAAGESEGDKEKEEAWNSVWRRALQSLRICDWGLFVLE